MSVSASAACGTCKKQKKKCDKKLPSCSRCLFVRRECKYEDKAALPVVTLGHAKSAPYELTLAQPHLLLSQCSDVDYFVLHNTVIRSGASELHVATVNYVLKILSSSGVSVQSMLGEYLRTIGTWLPVISRKRLYQGVSCMVAKPRADFALLLLSINLVLQPPAYHLEASSCLRNPAYYRMKQLFGLLQSANFRSVDMVQAGLLITAYEYGHGLFESAFLSIGICARMAHILGWREKSASLDGACKEEEIRVWWGIRAFERILDLDSNFSSAILIPDMNMSLPTEDEEWDLPPYGPCVQSPFPQTALLQAQGARLLGRAIGLTMNPPLSTEDRSQYDNKLKSTLIQFAIAVSDCSREEWGANCGALGLAYSAIYHLHLTPYNEASDSIDQNSIFELRRTTRIVVDIARTFQLCCLSNKPEINPGRTLPLTLHTLRQACLTHIKLAGAEFRSREWEDDLEALKNMLVFVNRRWALAGKVLSDIQDAYDKKVKGTN